MFLSFGCVQLLDALGLGSGDGSAMRLIIKDIMTLQSRMCKRLCKNGLSHLRPMAAACGAAASIL